MKPSSDQNIIFCYSCNKSLDIGRHQKVLRSEECGFCSANIHCCKMCSFYSETSYNECREPSSERIVEKEKANFCDFFKLKGNEQNINQDTLLDAANNLFKK